MRTMSAETTPERAKAPRAGRFAASLRLQFKDGLGEVRVALIDAAPTAG